jgi:hypothetical protein
MLGVTTPRANSGPSVSKPRARLGVRSWNGLTNYVDAARLIVIDLVLTVSERYELPVLRPDIGPDRVVLKSGYLALCRTS